MKLNFQPFQYEDELSWPGATRRSVTEATRARVRTGAVLRHRDGTVYVVGDINEILGACDDCCPFDYEDIAEIAYLWEDGEGPT